MHTCAPPPVWYMQEGRDPAVGPGDLEALCTDLRVVGGVTLVSNGLVTRPHVLVVGWHLSSVCPFSVGVSAVFL